MDLDEVFVFSVFGIVFAAVVLFGWYLGPGM